MIQLVWRKRRRTGHPKPAPGTYDVLAPGQLLAPHAPLLHEIREMVGVPDAHWRSLYDPMLQHYAAFVQQLPASEAHHHAGPGGLLAHGLEVLRNALKVRRGALLPRGAAPEEAARQQDLWTYAICSACLLHDIAKPVVDQRILLFDATGRSVGAWDPWSGPMPADHRYRVTFVRERQYPLHERLAPLFARIIVPQLGLSWLGSEPEVLRQWTATLTGHPEEAGAIGEIVHQADARSVALDLGGEQTRMPGARVKPLHERLVTGLRYLIDHGELPLNANGAAGWITQDSAWFVVKRALDQLREHLQQEGQTGIPTRNDRLMDELQQHGVVIPNGDKAVWKMRVFAPDWPKAHDLTLLRFPVERIWPDPESRPALFSGEITSIEAVATTPEQKPGTEATALPSPAPADTMVGDEAKTIESEAAGTGDIPLPPLAQANRQAEEPATENAKDSDEPDAGRRFLTWLRDGIQTGRLDLNATNARLHRVDEGLLLVSPGIFKDYRDPKGADWSYVQKRFTKLKLHSKNPDGTNIFAYDVSGKRRKGVIKGYLIPESELGRVIPAAVLPGPNPHLSPAGPAA